MSQRRKKVHIVVDLEMNRLDFKYENERKISTNGVIEIGVVAMNKKIEETGCFRIVLCLRMHSGLAGMSGRKSGMNGRTRMRGMIYNNIKVILYE